MGKNHFNKIFDYQLRVGATKQINYEPLNISRVIITIYIFYLFFNIFPFV